MMRARLCFGLFLCSAGIGAAFFVMSRFEMCSMVGKNDHGAQGAAFALFVKKRKKIKI